MIRNRAFLNVVIAIGMMASVASAVVTAAAGQSTSAVWVVPDFPLSPDQLEARGLAGVPPNADTSAPYQQDLVSGNFHYQLIFTYFSTRGWHITAETASYVRNADILPIRPVPRSQLFPGAEGSHWFPEPSAPRGVATESPPPPPAPTPADFPPPSSQGSVPGQVVNMGMTAWQGWYNVQAGYTWWPASSGSYAWTLSNWHVAQCASFNHC